MLYETGIVVGIAGALASIGGLLVAGLQTAKLARVRDLTRANLWQSVIITRRISIALEENQLQAGATSVEHLREHLIKELVLKHNNCDQGRLDHWINEGKITLEELNIARQFLTRKKKTSHPQKTHFSDLARFSESLHLIGLTDTTERLPKELVCDGIRESKTGIKICTTWIHGMPDLSEALSTAIHNGRSIEILLLNPKSRAAETRSEGLGFSDKSGVPRQIEVTLDWLRKIIPPQADNVVVKLYEEAPVFLMYLFDDTVVYCPAFHGDKLACARRQFIVTGKDTELFKTMLDQFNFLSSRSNPIQINMDNKEN